MNTFFIVIIIIVAIALLLILIFLISLRGLKDFIAPTNEINSINEMKRFIGINFDINYTIIEHISNNTSPDRPLRISIILSNESFNLVRNLVGELDKKDKEYLNKEKDVKYVENFTLQTDCFIKEYSASHLNLDGSISTFFIAKMNFNYATRTLGYSETGF